MARPNLFVRVICVCLASSFGGPGWPQQPETTRDQSKNKRTAWLHEAYLREASGYEFYLDDQKHEKLALRRQPVMRWTSGHDSDGDVYVWTHQGAAAIVGCIAWLQYQRKEVWRADPTAAGIFDGVTTKRYGVFQVKTIANQGDN